MESYRRITEKVRGALWAHHRRLMPERQFQRILAYVYNNKYEYQLRFDKMTCVGVEWDGKVEVATTPSGHIKRVRVNPEFEDLPRDTREKLIVSAYAKAARQGRELMQEAEMRVYNQFLRDLKPVVMGIRDNPEFYTVAEDTEELPHMTVASSDASDPNATHRTIAYAKSQDPVAIFRAAKSRETNWLNSNEGRKWQLTLQGKRFAKYEMPERRTRGAPGAKTTVEPTDLLAPYTEMDEKRLQRRNWQAFLENKNVAETMWTKTRAADRLQGLRDKQRTGRAWHSPVRPESSQQW